MIVNKQKVEKFITSKLDGIASHKNSFFSPNFKHVLHGVHFEYTPSGVYIWELVFPVFDPFGFNLTFSDRLPGADGYISRDQATPEALLSKIQKSSLINVLSDINNHLSVDEFIERFERDPRRLENAHVRFIYACALAMIGNCRSAKINFETSEPKLKGVDIENGARFKVALEGSADQLIQLLTEFELKNLKSFGVEVEPTQRVKMIRHLRSPPTSQ